MNRLDEWQKLCDAASEGPWSSFISDNKDMILAGDGAILIGYFWESSRHINQLEDKDHKFIAESRTAMPRLIQALSHAIGYIGVDPDRSDEICLEEIQSILEGK